MAKGMEPRPDTAVQVGVWGPKVMPDIKNFSYAYVRVETSTKSGIGYPTHLT
jgi:hypothetical protein